jgi:hypothetical protein
MKRLLFVFILLGGMMVEVFAQGIGVKGVVRDAESGAAMEFANVTLSTADSVFAGGVSTDGSGYFALSGLAAGEYGLTVSSLGYRALRIALNLRADVNLGDILLEEEAVELGGVSVQASNLTSTIDRKLVYPSDRQVKASTNGIDLLQQLMLPKLMVNPIFNEVSLPGGGELQFRINGAKVEREDIMALMPADIIRIEFHDNPGLRYGNAEVALDYIVRRPETGGSMGVDLSDAIGTEWGNNHVNGRINHKKSEFSAYYGLNLRNFHDMWRDNEERFVLADGSVLHRREEGRPGHLQVPWQNLNTTYSYAGDGRMFNATLRYYSSDQPHIDYRGILYNVENPSDAVSMDDRSAYLTRRPALDLYYQQDMKHGQTLVFNLVGTYNYTDNRRMYSESRGDVLLTSVNNAVEGRKYSYIGEGIYEKKLGEQRIGAGVKHTQSSSSNTYINEAGRSAIVNQDQGETYLYGEFKGRAGKLDYTVGLGATRAYFTQGSSDSYVYYTFNPRLVLHYNLTGGSFIRLRSDMNSAAPSLSDLSDVSVLIDSLQIQRGNPSLRPFVRSSSELTYELRKGIFYANLGAAYEYQPGAIMDEKYPEGDKIVQTWNNQKSWQRLGSRAMLRVGPVKDILQLSVTSGVNHYISHGNTYLHRYTNWYTFAEASATYKGFSASMIMEIPWNSFYGETMSGGEKIHLAMLGYKYRELSFTVGIFCPFADNYKQESENRSQYASYKKTNYINESSRMVALMFRYNFSFGRTFKAGERRLNNADEDSGVMSTGK